MYIFMSVYASLYDMVLALFEFSAPVTSHFPQPAEVNLSLLASSPACDYNVACRVTKEVMLGRSAPCVALGIRLYTRIQSSHRAPLSQRATPHLLAS